RHRGHIAFALELMKTLGDPVPAVQLEHAGVRGRRTVERDLHSRALATGLSLFVAVADDRKDRARKLDRLRIAAGLACALLDVRAHDLVEELRRMKGMDMD